MRRGTMAWKIAVYPRHRWYIQLFKPRIHTVFWNIVLVRKNQCPFCVISRIIEWDPVEFVRRVRCCDLKAFISREKADFTQKYGNLSLYFISGITYGDPPNSSMPMMSLSVCDIISNKPTIIMIKWSQLRKSNTALTRLSFATLTSWSYRSCVIHMWPRTHDILSWYLMCGNMLPTFGSAGSILNHLSYPRVLW